MSDDEFEFPGLDKKELFGVGNLAGHYANNQRLKDIQGRECFYFDSGSQPSHD